MAWPSRLVFQVYRMDLSRSEILKTCLKRGIVVRKCLVLNQDLASLAVLVPLVIHRRKLFLFATDVLLAKDQRGIFLVTVP